MYINRNTKSNNMIHSLAICNPIWCDLKTILFNKGKKCFCYYLHLQNITFVNSAAMQVNIKQ